MRSEPCRELEITNYKLRIGNCDEVLFFVFGIF